MSAGDVAADPDQWETRPCEPRVSNEDAEDWCAIAQWESDRADRWKVEVAALRRQLEERYAAPEIDRKLTEADLTKWLKVDKRWTAFVNGFHECLRRFDDAYASRRPEPAPSPDVATPRPADLWAIHWSPGCWDLHEDRYEAEGVARTGICDLVPLWMHEPPGEADVVTVPQEEWTVAQILANAWRRHPLTCDERDKLLAEWDALRSGEAEGGEK